jgi:hypothetical protein
MRDKGENKGCKFYLILINCFSLRWLRPIHTPAAGIFYSESARSKTRSRAFQPHPRCIPGASQMHPRCIPDASQMHPRSIPTASQMHPRCIPEASQPHPRSISGASQVHPRQVQLQKYEPVFRPRSGFGLSLNLNLSSTCILSLITEKII